MITSPSSKVPPEFKDEAVLLDFPPPTAAELDAVLNTLARAPGVKVSLTKLGREKLVQASLGLTSAQAHRVFSRAIVTDGVLDDRDITMVTDEKKQIIRESEALEYYEFTESPADVGGLDVLKEWLRLREKAFTQAARDYGLPPPKGIALIGIPGTGKSLTAKMIAGLWRLPLLRFDVGSLFGSLVGESEERARRALQVAGAVAPCVLWLDEMEKSLAHGGQDAGTSTRVFGAILTWMQEKTVPCFVVATANDISALPPELLRKGRFDEIFFLDLPTTVERREIFSVHLRKRKRLVQDFDVQRLAAQTNGYVGAEIEQTIIDAMYVGFNEGREFTSEDISRRSKNKCRFQYRSVRRWTPCAIGYIKAAPNPPHLWKSKHAGTFGSRFWYVEHGVGRLGPGPARRCAFAHCGIQSHGALSARQRNNRRGRGNSQHYSLRGRSTALAGTASNIPRVVRIGAHLSVDEEVHRPAQPHSGEARWARYFAL